MFVTNFVVPTSVARIAMTVRLAEILFVGTIKYQVLVVDSQTKRDKTTVFPEYPCYPAFESRPFFLKFPSGWRAMPAITSRLIDCEKEESHPIERACRFGEKEFSEIAQNFIEMYVLQDFWTVKCFWAGLLCLCWKRVFEKIKSSRLLPCLSRRCIAQTDVRLPSELPESHYKISHFTSNPPCLFAAPYSEEFVLFKFEAIFKPVIRAATINVFVRWPPQSTKRGEN